jgi:hypothetical protein
MRARRSIVSLAACLSMIFSAASSASVRTATLVAESGHAPAEAQVGQMPKMVLIIRHAEKPTAKDESPDLTERGRERTKVIPSLFLPVGKARFERPEALFATRATKKSNRPIETIIPLSEALNLPIEEKYGRGDLAALAQELSSGKYAGKVVLISWHHAEMKELAQSLGVEDPPEWPETLFDRIWKIDWNQGKANLVSLPQMLLPGDATQ